jgi:hypothetical protein
MGWPIASMVAKGCDRIDKRQFEDRGTEEGIISKCMLRRGVDSTVSGEKSPNILNTVTNLRMAKSADNFLTSQVGPFCLQLQVVIDYAFSLSPHLYPVYGNDLVATALWVILF